LLKDKTVLITGGDSGIGCSVAVLMTRESEDVSIVYLPDEEDAPDTMIVEKAGRRAYLMALDLRKSENCRRAVEEHIKAFGKLSVLVNNSEFGAGVLELDLLICDHF
jgi:NAD(P)-dependent dehydrogenase (short-subunit alcohol dehydrogenase family)